MKAAFIGNQSGIDGVYAGGRRERLAAEFDLIQMVLAKELLCEKQDDLKDVRLLFSTWGMPSLSQEQIAFFPSLQALFYAAGSVQHFARPFLESGVKVVSACGANAVAVAEFTVAQILLANKGGLRAVRATRSRAEWVRHHASVFPGNFETTVALLGAGMIGSAVIKRLKFHALEVLVFDPFLSDEKAAALGVEKVGLEEAFARGFIVSNHLADVPATRGLLREELFRALPLHATFINTGRGATVYEPSLIKVLTDRPDLSAVLDVTVLEPPEEGNPLYQLENVFLTPHLAGAIGREVWRMADFMIDEAIAFREGKPLQYEVKLEMLDFMA